MATKLPMVQHSKILQSRDDWREKAVNRADEIRILRKVKKRQQKRVAELKAQISAMEQASTKKNT